MRILLVHERFDTLGGAEATVLLTARELQRRGHSVGLLCQALPKRELPVGQEVFSSCFRFSGPNPELAEVWKTLKIFRPDLVFVHNLAHQGTFAALLDSGRPVVRVIHDHDLYCLRSYKYNPVTRHVCHRALTPYCLFPCCAFLRRDSTGRRRAPWTLYEEKKREIQLNQRCRGLIVASDYMQKELLRNGFEQDQIQVVPPGLSVATRAQSSFSERNLIVFTGQLIRGKGVDALLRALSEIDVRFTCLIAGDGNHRSFCEKRARTLGLDDRVRFGGFMPRAELDTAYAEASVAVVSSLWPEPFGLVGLEAMRFGLPVVAFDAGGIGEWLIDGSNGYLIPWRDTRRFADAVQRLLEDKTLGRLMGQRGTQLLAERFDLSTYVSGLEDLFVRYAEKPSLKNDAVGSPGSSSRH